MSVKSYKLGPGVLELGTAPLDVAAQVRSMTVKAAEKVERTEAIPTLSGDELAAEESTSYDWTLTGNVIQDITSDGLTDWSWENKGTPQPCRFVPNTAEGRECVGVIYPVPVDFGGDVDKTKRPEAAITWRFQGEPVLGVITP